MSTEPTFFRNVWVTLGRLREYLERDGESSPMARDLAHQLTLDIAEAERELQVLNRGVGENWADEDSISRRNLFRTPDTH